GTGDVAPTDFLMLFYRLDSSRRRRSLKAHDTADTAGRAGGCRRRIITDCKVVFSLLGRATNSKERQKEQYNKSLHRGILSGGRGSGMGLLIGGNDCRYAKTPFKSSSVILRYQFQGIGGRMGRPVP